MSAPDLPADPAPVVDIMMLKQGELDARGPNPNGKHDQRPKTRVEPPESEQTPASPDGVVAPLPRLKLVPMADVVPVPVEWLWEARLPRGKLAVLAGDPGLGKSYLTLKMAAIISTGGEWPDRSVATPANVLIVSAEDDAADTIRPRLDRLGADVSRITMIEGVLSDDTEVARPFSLRLDIEMLRGAIGDTAAAIVVVDPLNAFLGGIDSHKAAEVRGVLAPLAHVANTTHAAVLAVHHLNKGTSSNALYRASGSLDFVAAARIVHGVAADPEVKGRRVFVPVKCNISVMPEGIGFRIGEDGVTFDDLPVTLDAAAAFTTRSVDHEERSEREMAKDFLRAELANGPVPAVALLRTAKGSGFFEKTVRRAALELRVVKSKSGYQGTSYWSLLVEAKDGRLSDVATFDASEPEPAADVAIFDDPIDHPGSVLNEPAPAEAPERSKDGRVQSALRLEGPKGGPEDGWATIDDAPTREEPADPSEGDPAIPVVSVEAFRRAVEVVVAVGAASESLIAKRCGCSVDEAAIAIGALEAAGVVDAESGRRSRCVLIGDGDVEGVVAAFAGRLGREKGAGSSDLVLAPSVSAAAVPGDEEELII